MRVIHLLLLVVDWICRVSGGGGGRTEDLSEAMLDILELDAVPHPALPNRHLAAPRFMMDLYAVINAQQNAHYHPHVSSFGGTTYLQQEEVERALVESDLVMSFPNHANQTYGASLGYYFDTRDVPVDEDMLCASLHIFKKLYPWHNGVKRAMTVTVHRVTDDKVNTLDESAESLVSRTTVMLAHRGWVELNVSSLVEHWLNFPRDNLGLRVTITDDRGTDVYPSQVGIVDPYVSDEEQAFLVAFFKKNKKKIHVRRTRAASGRKKEYSYENYVAPPVDFTSSMEECHRESFLVRFSDLNWQDWIIAPDSYDAHFCAGRCRFPLHLHLNATNHAIVQTLVALYNSNIPQTHCAPISLSSITVLHFDNYSNIMLKKYQRMVAESCGCH